MAEDKDKQDAWARPPENPAYLWMSGKVLEWDKAMVHASMMGWTISPASNAVNPDPVLR